MKKKMKIYVPILIVVVLIILSIVINKNKNKYIEVREAKIGKGNVEAYLSTTGQVKSKNSIEYYGSQAKVQTLKVKEGDSVKKGDILLTYDVPNVENNIKQAELQYNNAILQKESLLEQRDKINNKISNLNKKINELENSKDPKAMVKLESVKSQKEAIQPISDSQIKQVENAIKIAELNLNTAKENANKVKSNIVSKNDGIVTAVNVKIGSMDNLMSPAIVVEDVNNLKVNLSLSKYDLERIKLGQKSLIKWGNNTLNGEVSYISPAAENSLSSQGSIPNVGASSEKTLKVEVDIKDKPENLKIGFDADVEILTGNKENVIRIPNESIKMDKKDNIYVYVIKDDKVKERKIKLGLQSEEWAEVLEGLKEGERVVLNPPADLTNGAFIKLKK